MKKFPAFANYDKRPVVTVPDSAGEAWQGWPAVAAALRKQVEQFSKNKVVVVLECYAGVNLDEVLSALVPVLQPAQVFLAADILKSEDEINRMVQPDVTDDRVFGYLTRFTIENFIDTGKRAAVQTQLAAISEGVVLVAGIGASTITHADVLVYADMPRWEGQLRFRNNTAANLGVTNYQENAAAQYKRAFFVDWRVCDRLKKGLFERLDFVLDTVVPQQPRMATGASVRKGLKQAVTRPFRVVPFFDPGPWGGQWMKEVCDLDRDVVNFAWCFDCVPEENSLLLGIDCVELEIPSQNLVYYQPKPLLGEAVYGRFGDEFPIRFDFLDTVEGGNLSLQVHPLTQYIQQQFGMHYTQDESYYMLDAYEGAHVYLGLKEGIVPSEMIQDLEAAQTSGVFDAEKYVQKWPVKKHDHVLIPAGTVHCSGAESMVLEISATPYIFTFKLWDWGRLGLDGRPRPIHLEHGAKNIQWDRTTEWTKQNILRRVTAIGEGDGWREERTGLHEAEFIETRRHWFTKTVPHHTAGAVNVLNLVEGAEAIVESPEGRFEPFVVHYAETFIVPAAVGAYTIRPYGAAEGKECATVKAFVRTN